MLIVSFISKDPSQTMFLPTLISVGLCILIYEGVSKLCKKWFKEKNWKWICLGIFGTLFISWCVISSISYLNDTRSLDPGTREHTVQNLFRRFFFIINNNGGDIGWFHDGYSSLSFSDALKVIFGLKGFGTDWLGLFPYLPYIFLGGFVGETVYKDNKSIIKYFFHKEDTVLVGEEYLLSPQGQMNAKINRKLSAIMFPGRHTLFIYMFHEPAFVIIVIPIILLFGYHLAF
ncbi:MAG: hypothetical protein HUJ61_05490 [Bacilli bacterium]|nr:hypothetical protein [Bacilli bacterium]